MRTNIKNLLSVVLLIVAACSCGHRNSEGTLLPEFEEYTFSSAEEGRYSVNIRYQRIANAQRSEALASIDNLNYAHTFDEYFVVPPCVEESVAALVEDYAAICNHNHTEDEECVACSYTLDQQAMLLRNETILCFETCVETYSGGAHGGYSLLYECYDLATGAFFDFEYLIDGEWAEAMQQLIYHKLYEVCDEVLFVDSPESIYIPRSVKITDDGLLLVYQPYEVAAFNVGIVTVEISEAELLEAGAPLVWVE